MNEIKCRRCNEKVTGLENRVKELESQVGMLQTVVDGSVEISAGVLEGLLERYKETTLREIEAIIKILPHMP